MSASLDEQIAYIDYELAWRRARMRWVVAHGRPPVVYERDTTAVNVLELVMESLHRLKRLER